MGVGGKGLKARFSGKNLIYKLSCGLSSKVIYLRGNEGGTWEV